MLTEHSVFIHTVFYLFIYLFICLFVCLFVCLYRWLSADNANSVRLTANPSLTPPSTPLNTVRSRDKGDESLSHAQSSNSEDSSITNQYLQQLR